VWNFVIIASRFWRELRSDFTGQVSTSSGEVDDAMAELRRSAATHREDKTGGTYDFVAEVWPLRI